MGTDSTRIVELFESALRDFWSSDVCSDYLQWVMRPDSDFDFATSKEVHSCSGSHSRMFQKFERILQIVGLRPDCGALFWLGYLDYVELVSSLPTDGAQGDTSGNKGVAEMTSLFARALKVPQKGLSDIWDRYVDYAGKTAVSGNHMTGNLDQHDSVSISHEIKKSYELALKKYNEELSDLEANLVSSVNKEEAYAAYVDYELDNGDPARIQLIFERSVEVLPFCSTLWYQYLRWLDTELKVHQVRKYGLPKRSVVCLATQYFRSSSRRTTADASCASSRASSGNALCLRWNVPTSTAKARKVFGSRRSKRLARRPKESLSISRTRPLLVERSQKQVCLWRLPLCHTKYILLQAATTCVPWKRCSKKVSNTSRRATERASFAKRSPSFFMPN